MIEPQTVTLPELGALTSDIVAGAGVYFLWKDSELLYVGSSNRTVMDRISQQARYRDFGHSNLNYWRPRVPFNRYTILPCEPNDARDIEAALIKRFEPPYNETHMPGDPG